MTAPVVNSIGMGENPADLPRINGLLESRASR
jgi:hypothetical protein